jgi:hypothetical protein
MSALDRSARSGAHMAVDEGCAHVLDLGSGAQPVESSGGSEGLTPPGDRLETPVLGLYEVRCSRLVRAQMFYFDPVGTGDFLVWARERGLLDRARD